MLLSLELIRAWCCCSLGCVLTNRVSSLVAVSYLGVSTRAARPAALLPMAKVLHFPLLTADGCFLRVQQHGSGIVFDVCTNPHCHSSLSPPCSALFLLLLR